VKFKTPFMRAAFVVVSSTTNIVAIYKSTGTNDLFYALRQRHLSSTIYKTCRRILENALRQMSFNLL